MFDKCYHVLLYFQYSLSNVIDILANNECLFLRHSCFPKKAFAIFGGWPRRGAKWTESCPKIGVSCFRKKGFAEKGT